MPRRMTIEQRLTRLESATHAHDLELQLLKHGIAEFAAGTRAILDTISKHPGLPLPTSRRKR